MITETTPIGAVAVLLAGSGFRIRHVRCVGGIWHATLLVDEAHALGGKTSSEGMGPTLASSIEDARLGYVRHCEVYLRACDEPDAREVFDDEDEPDACAAGCCREPGHHGLCMTEEEAAQERAENARERAEQERADMVELHPVYDDECFEEF